MAAYLFELVEFRFPKALNDDHANFRLVVNVRYKTAKHQFETHTVVMPGTDSYWECSKEENQETAEKATKHKLRDDRYTRLCVRALDDNDKYLNNVDMTLASSWDRSFRLSAERLYEVRVTVLDVDRKDWFEKIGDIVKGALNLLPFTEGFASAVGSSLARESHGVLFVGVGQVTDSQAVCEDDRYFLQFQVTDPDAEKAEEVDAAGGAHSSQA